MRAKSSRMQVAGVGKQTDEMLQGTNKAAASRTATISRRQAFSVGARYVTMIGLATYPSRRALARLFDKPLRLIVPQAAGGTGDAVIRVVARELAERLGQSVVVENKPGAGGTIGAALVTRAEPDGSHLVLLSTGFATWSVMYPQLTFDSARDLAPVAMIGSVPFAMLVHGDSPYHTLAEFLDYARSTSELVGYSSAGPGNVSHLLPAWLATEAHVPMTHIPYNGTAPALQALMGKQVACYFDPVSTCAELVKSGKLKALATTGSERADMLPDTPTLVEQGYAVKGTVWLGLATTAGAPKKHIDSVSAEIGKLLEAPRVRTALTSRGLTIEPMGPEQFSHFLAEEKKKWVQIVRANKIVRQ